MSLFYKIDLRKPTPATNPIKFPVYNSKSHSISDYQNEIWGNVLTTYTVENFNILNLYSGYGHCGSLTTYDLSGNQTKSVHLKMQANCNAQTKVRDPEKEKEIMIKH